jgi:hypothetical protein
MTYIVFERNESKELGESRKLINEAKLIETENGFGRCRIARGDDAECDKRRDRYGRIGQLCRL